MTDTERLDWIERKWATVYRSESGGHWVFVDERGRGDRHGVVAKTLREAIDASAENRKGVKS